MEEFFYFIINKEHLKISAFTRGLLRTSDTRSRKFVNPVALFASHGCKADQTLFRTPVSPSCRKRDLRSYDAPFRSEKGHDNAHASGRLQGATRSTLEPDVDYTLPYRA